jgi:hypothetical protein
MMRTLSSKAPSQVPVRKKKGDIKMLKKIVMVSKLVASAAKSASALQPKL